MLNKKNAHKYSAKLLFLLFLLTAFFPLGLSKTARAAEFRLIYSNDLLAQLDGAG